MIKFLETLQLVLNHLDLFAVLVLLNLLTGPFCLAHGAHKFLL